MLFAILVGINEYADPLIPELRWARADAEAMAEKIRKIDADEHDICLLLNEQATRSNVLSAIGRDLYQQAGPDDVALVYFAGHGCREMDGPLGDVTHYLACHDTRKGDILSTGIELRDGLLRLLQRVRAGLTVVFLDACFSGGVGASPGRRDPAREAPGSRGFDGPGVAAATPQRLRSGISLEGLDLGEGKALLTACGSAQTAREDDAKKHGIFTHHLLEAISRPRAAAAISIAVLYEEVREAVEQDTERRQRPVFVSPDGISGAALPVLF
jgi:uncharacterized caspase-like protein